MSEKIDPLKPISIFEMQLGSYSVPAAIVSRIQEKLKTEVNFMTVRSKLMKKYPANPENLGYPGPEKGYQEGTVVIDDVESRDLEWQRFIFFAYVDMLKIDTDDAESVSDLDLVSAAVALEIWSSVFYLDKWSNAWRCAGIEGPDALNSLSAIIARSLGKGVPCMPFDPDFPKALFDTKIFFNTIRLCRGFVSRTLGDSEWPEVVIRVVSDLGYAALGNSRSHNAALLAQLCMLQIS